ncbi:hypothetical protein C8A00DRAFT_33629 [Chaetomidium leptoderma]|uniref:Uncharacterized protein n=1 Tax=Chaetomidium leptoderma TaxID=669021 RepID=A0AAN6ZXC0_9PEZI|nr:hypothetical protein C8A00DRAFT_33629 [Chaetomidium leptoderma]
MNLAIPVKLDAFVFNKSVCNGKPGDATTPPDAKIAPITQPNYTFLRLDSNLIHSDVLAHTDLHDSIPWSNNPRLVDLGQGGAVRSQRLGVYLHWIVPRFYRRGVAATPSASAALAEQRRAEGLAVPPQTSPDYSSPEFPQLPNRWLVIRRLDPDAATTIPNSKGGAQVDPVVAWVVESDRSRKMGDPTLLTADLQVDVSPFITHQSASGSPAADISIGEQAEIFIGYKAAAKAWSEDPTADRADLNVATASNQLFPDYQPHCSNVFSILDPFTCTMDGKPGNLTSAVASYYVMGWHSDAANDPLGSTSSTVTREVRLKRLSTELKGSPPWPQDMQEWLNSTKAARVLCQGAMYDVQWNVDKPPPKTPANDASHQLTGSMPVSVGTTPMDALLAYVKSHQKTELEMDLFALAPLLRAQDDGVQAQRVAVDELQSWNFSRQSGGVHWHFQNKAGNAAQAPTPDEANYLEQLNDAQRLWDTTARQLVQARWNMFSYWWKYASLSDDDRKQAQFPLAELSRKFKDLQTLVTGAKQVVDSLSKDTTKFSQLPMPGVNPDFSQRRDPSLLVGGIEAGWPDDYLDTLLVRLDSQLMQPPTPVGDISAYCTSVLPDVLQPTARALVQEFLALAPSDTARITPTGEQQLPLYHDHGKHGNPSGPLRDQWGATQPWFPLFAEWEAEYFHVKWDDWQLYSERKSQLDEQWKLGVKPGVDLSKEAITDTRTLSGRILLLPQPNFSLQAAIADLFSNTDPKLIDKYLPNTADQQLVQTKAYTLPFLSSPMDGFTAELLTLAKGTHIKPNAMFPQTGFDLRGLQPLPDAEIGPFGPKELAIIGANSELTPFGTLVKFGNLLESDPSAIPFKPCTHGQFRLSKLNIIDKFGQVICAIDPRYGYEDTQAVYPCLGDFLTPGQLDDGQPNVVEPSPQPGHNEFAQVPPAINQPSRLNCCFVTHDHVRQAQGPGTTDSTSTYSYWRPTSEWENPIWGWVVLNYVDYGIQLFLADGTFYREVRIAAPTAPISAPTSAKWLPFDPPPAADTGHQLDRLLALLTAQDQTYLLAFLDMLSQSLESSTSSPGAYSTFLNSLVGRPMALVNAAWSLELASDAKTDQSSLDGHETKQQETGLLEGAEIYRFPVKLGDTDRAHDGLVGYFNALADPKPGDELDLSAIYTYYYTGGANGNTGTAAPRTTNTPPLNPIGPTNYPTLPAFWLDPATTSATTTNTQQQPKTPPQSAATYTQAWNSKLTAFGMIIDPFTPVTSYTGGVQPIGNLQLAPWTWQAALHQMTAFFRVGPLLVTNDVQRYWDPAHTLGPAYALSPPDKDETVPGSGVQVPSLDVARWAWLQPFFVVEKNEEDGDDHGEGLPETKYMALGLAKVDDKPGFERGPYTAIEGFLQLKEPIISPEAPAPPAPSPST